MSITPDFLKKKAREISYAINKISFYIKREDLRQRLERLSFELLENVAISSEDAFDKQALFGVFKNVSALDILVRIGYSLYEIEPVNANILIKELDSFNSAVRQFGNPAIESELPNLEAIFSAPPAVIAEPSNSEIKQEDSSAKEIIRQSGNSENNIFGNPAIRQSAYSENYQPLITEGVLNRQNLISEKIRQFGNVSPKELLVHFPNVSERTLRYDLQKLCDKGLVEKLGNTGPGISYRVKN
jgi:hypothetical protein